MFKKHENKTMWIVIIVIIAIMAIILILQAQIFMMLRDSQTSIFGDFVKDANPLPPAMPIMSFNVFR